MAENSWHRYDIKKLRHCHPMYSDGEEKFHYILHCSCIYRVVQKVNHIFFTPMLLVTLNIHRVSKNVPPLACYNFDAHEWILIFFGRNVTDKVSNQKTLYYATSYNVCFCTSWQKTRKHENYIFHSIGIVLHTMHLCAIFLKEEKIVICDVFDSV